MAAWIEIVVPFLGAKEAIMALLDSGCTHCMINTQVVEKPGLRLRKLRQPMAFSQLDRSITG